MPKKPNIEQKSAITHKEGPLLIIAGAGTGKTEVITQRIIHIMNQGWANPSEILALTFMEKAAAEMEERIDKEMALGYEEPTISTFHSFCDKILRQEAFFLGIDPDYKLMTESESFIFFKKHLYEFSLKEYRPVNNPKKFISILLKYFSRLQDGDIFPEEYLKYAKGSDREMDPELAQVYKEFTELKAYEGRVTFADLISTTLRLFREKPDILKKYRNLYKYILVDEYQDTNYSQNVLVNTLVLGKDYQKASSSDRKKANITVVGDDDQAIYKFRGAAISNILEFKNIYPESKKIVLTKNYRSNQEILDSAHGLIKNNDPFRLEVTEGIDKRLISKVENPVGGVKLIPAFNASEEAEVIACQILKLVGGDSSVVDLDYKVFDSTGQSSFLEKSSVGSYKFSDIAILVRANSHIDDIVPILRYYKIPFKFRGKKGLYTRPEIKCLVSFLLTLADYKSNVDFFNVLQMDLWGLKTRDFIEIFSEAKRQKISAFEVVESVLNIKVGAKRFKKKTKLAQKSFSKKSLETLYKIMELHQNAFESIDKSKSPTDILYNFLTDSGYIKSLDDDNSENAFKLENIGKFFNLTKVFEQKNKGVTVYEYIEYIEYSIEVGETPSIDDDVFTEYDAVNISTVHGVKGLEFPVVFLPCLVKGRFPSRNMKDSLSVPSELLKDDVLCDTGSEDNIQEERRLFYVAATRAQDYLMLSSAQYYNEGKRINKPSVFLDEILQRVPLEEFASLKGSSKISLPRTSETDNAEYGSLIKDLGSRISYSEINDYERCPKSYQYKYILKIPTPLQHPASFGTIIHATLRDFYLLLKTHNEGLDGVFEKPTFDDLMALYKKHWRSDGFESEKQEKETKNNGKEVLEKFFKEIYTGEEKVMFLEKRFEVNVDGVVVSGVVDRADRIDEQSVSLYDYKTGKGRGQKEVEKDIQLMIYGLYAKRVLGAQKINASLIFLKEGVVIETEISDEKLNMVSNKILEVSGLIKKCNFEAKPDQHKCQFCDYNKICSNSMV